MRDLASIVTAYDIRGVVPDQLDDRPLSQLLADYARYHASGEVNSQVADQAEATERVKQAFERRPGVRTEELDGLTVSTGDWWFNLRPAALRDEVLDMVRTEMDI